MKLKSICTLLFAAFFGIAPSLTASDESTNLSKDYESVDPNKPVICLLPGKVKRLGSIMTYLSPRRPVEMIASECEIRGGEYTLYDRAHYATALKLWEKEGRGRKGDTTAQIHAGEIYERGWMGEPDYAKAAEWYAKAANQGDRRAQRKLAYLYENGLGVQQDKERALDLWRSALGFEEGLVLASEVEAAKSEAQRKIDRLVEQLKKQNLQTGRLQRELDDVQSSLTAQAGKLETERARLRRLQSELEKASRKAGDTGNIPELERELAESRSRVEEQRLTIELLKADISAQRAQVAASVKQAEARGRQLDKARERLLAEASRGDDLLLQLEEKEQSLSNLESRLGKARAELEKSRQLRAQLAEQLEADDTSVQRASEQQLAAARQEIVKQEAEIQRVQEQIRQERADFKEQLDNLEMTAEGLTASLEESRKEKEVLARRLEKADQRMTKVSGDLEEARYALADARANAVGLRDQLSALDNDEDNARRELQNRIRQQEKTISSLEQEKEELIDGWKKIAAERDNLIADLGDRVKKSSWLDVELSNSEAKLAATQEELRRVREALENANSEKQELMERKRHLAAELAENKKDRQEDVAALQEKLREVSRELAEITSGKKELLEQQFRLEGNEEFIIAQRTSKMRGEGTVTPTIAAAPNFVKTARFTAIIIANYDYPYYLKLDSPPNDANDLKLLLEKTYGFDEVDVLINQNSRQMRSALGKLRQFDEDDFVLLYYAGHGKMDEYDTGYWLPNDYRMDEPLANAISSVELTHYMKQSKAKHLMVIADSCYSGTLARNAEPVLRKSIPAMLEHWIASRSRTVLTSGGMKPVLDAGPDGHSVFASALLTVLGNNSGVLNGEMLHARIYNLVEEQATALGYLDQQPQFAAVEDAMHQNGQFVFVPTAQL